MLLAEGSGNYRLNVNERPKLQVLGLRVVLLVVRLFDLVFERVDLRVLPAVERLLLFERERLLLLFVLAVLLDLGPKFFVTQLLVPKPQFFHCWAQVVNSLQMRFISCLMNMRSLALLLALNRRLNRL